MPTATALRTDLFTDLSSVRRQGFEPTELVIERFNYWNDGMDASVQSFCGTCFRRDDDDVA